MRDIDQQWGAARTLLGLADLARLTGEPGGAQRQYAEALAILRTVSARPEIARCLAGLGRIAMDQEEITLARQYLTESIGLSRSMGNRIGMIRGLEAFAALAAKEKQPDRAVQLAAAAAALREAAHLPPPPGPSACSPRPAASGQPPSHGCGRKAPPWRPAPPSSWPWPCRLPPRATAVPQPAQPPRKG
jgi:hypothetical protein